MRTLLISFLFVFFISFDLNSQIPTYVPTNGLVGWWPFNGNANDESGNGHNGNIYSNVTSSTDRFNSPNAAYFIDTATNSLEGILIPHNPALSLGTGINKKISISLWFKNDNLIETGYYGSVGYILSKSLGNSTQVDYRIFLEELSLYWGTGRSPLFGGDVCSWLETNAPSSSQNWNHVVVTLNQNLSNISGVKQIYINGTLVTTCTYNFKNGMNTDPLLFGVYGYIGKIDDIGIWNRVLTHCEIQNLYNTSISDFLEDSLFSCNSPVSIQPSTTFTNYSWSNGSTSSSIIATSTGWYNCTVTNSGSCTYTDSTFVSIIDASLNQNDTTICIGDSMGLSISQNSTFSPCSSTALPPNLQNGLMAYYPFCGNADDESGNGLDGSILGATLTSDRFGEMNSAFYFNGINSRIEILNSSLFNLDSFSISVWFERHGNGNGNFDGLVSKYNSTSGYLIGIDDYYLPSSSAGFWIRHSANPSFDIIHTNNPIPILEWNHLVATFDGYGNMHMFLNGTQQTESVNNAILINNLDNLYIGQYLISFFHGKIDDIGIWNRVLSPSEIQQLYQNSYAYSWSTGDSTSSISVIPDSTTTYYCTISNGYHSCIDSVTITVSNPTLEFAMDSISICDGDLAYVEADLGWLSYLWSDSTSTSTLITSTDGIYTLTVTNVYGCAAIDSLAVLVNPLPQIGLADTVDICFGSSTELNAGAGFASYEWSNDSSNPIISVSSGGFYAVTVVDPNGCSNSDSTFIQINAIPELNLGNDTSICNGQTVNFDAGLGQYTYIWSTGATSQGITTSIGGFYSVTITDANFCQNSDSVLVLVNSLPIIHLGEDQSICIGDFTTLNAGLFNSYQWSTGENSQQIQVYSTDTYLVTVTDGNGCQGIDSINVTVNPLPTLNLGNDTTFCMGNSILLSAGTFSNYQWSTSETSASIIVNSSNTYLVTITDGNGCQNSDSIEITIHQLPVLSLGSDTSICEGSSFQLYVGIFDSYQWSTGESTSSIIVNLTDSYSVTVANSNGCQNSDSIEILINPLPLLNLGNDTSICEGSSLQLYAGTFDSYLWSTGDTSSSIISGISNNYLVTVTDSNGCQNSDEIVLIINALPTVSLGNDIIACEDESVSIDAGSGFAQYNWSNGEGTQSISPSITANYSVTVTDGYGCSGFDEIFLEFFPYPSILLDPQDQTVYLTDNAYFAITAAPISQLQWQTNQGLGFVNLSNAGQYSGVTTNTLTVSNCTTGNNNQLFRCIVTNWQCSDTSSIANLGVRNEIGVVEFDDSVVKIYPNPVQDEVFIEVESVLLIEKIQVILHNSLGQNVLQSEIIEETTRFNVSSLPAGVYHLDVFSKTGLPLKSKRIVITQ